MKLAITDQKNKTTNEVKELCNKVTETKIVNSTNFESKPHRILSKYSKPHVAHSQMPNLEKKKEKIN
jgi:hypothetical protein